MAGAGRVSWGGSSREQGGVPDLVAISPHQDDEVLSMGAAILEAVAARLSVAVLLVSRGEGSVVRTRTSRLRRRHLPRRLGFVPSPHHFAALRDSEFDGAVRAMGAIPIIPAYEERLPDGAASPEEVARLVRANVAPGTAVMTLSVHDNHPDHQACGQAVQRLVADGYLSEAAYFISPERLDLVPDGVVLRRAGGGTPVRAKHQRPYRVRDPRRNWWGIGELSVKESFDHQLRRDPLAYRHD